MVWQGAVPSMEEGRQQNAGYLNASAAAERLQRNVNREHFLCTDFLLAFWQVRTICSHPATLHTYIPQLPAPSQSSQCQCLSEEGGSVVQVASAYATPHAVSCCSLCSWYEVLKRAHPHLSLEASGI